jgi:CRP/FNR family transcriptional regulator
LQVYLQPKTDLDCVDAAMAKLLPKHAAMLATSDWYRRLPTGVQAMVLGHLAVSRRPAGQALFHQGDLPVGLHVILSGELHVTGTAPDGISTLMGILRPGDWTGFLAVLDENPYAFTVAAVVDSEVACLPLAAVRAIFEGDVATYKLLVAPELMNARRNWTCNGFVPVTDLTMPPWLRMRAG